MVRDLLHLNAIARRSATPNEAGYLVFKVGGFTFSRDEYFAHIGWTANGTKLSHKMSADAFLQALMRDVAWGFFYGSVDFDDVFGTRNLYGKVEFYAGRYARSYNDQQLDYAESFDATQAMEACRAILHDWTNTGYDPFAAPRETGLAWTGKKVGHNTAAIGRTRDACKRMVGMRGDTPLRSDANRYPVNRAFLDVTQEEPEIHAEPGFEAEVHAFNLFAYLSRSDVTWNPSVTSVCGLSLFCPTTEEHVMPVKHANDRIEWFLQLSDQIEWRVEDRVSGLPRATVLMCPGDVAAMPADVRHQGFARKRAMLLVWENADSALPSLYEQGKLPPSLAGEFAPGAGGPPAEPGSGSER